MNLRAYELIFFYNKYVMLQMILGLIPTDNHVELFRNCPRVEIKGKLFSALAQEADEWRVPGGEA